MNLTGEGKVHSLIDEVLDEQLNRLYGELRSKTYRPLDPVLRG
jgi:hypothetical protein